MPFVPFNSDKDKITERELVYDIFERLKLGKELRDSNGVNYKKDTFITDIINKLISMLPPAIMLRYLDVKTYYIDIPAGSKTASIRIKDLKENKVLLAISQQNGSDLTDCMDIHVDTDGALLCSISVVSAYKNRENIKIYAY